MTIFNSKKEVTLLCDRSSLSKLGEELIGHPFVSCLQHNENGNHRWVFFSVALGDADLIFIFGYLDAVPANMSTHT